MLEQGHQLAPIVYLRYPPLSVLDRKLGFSFCFIRVNLRASAAEKWLFLSKQGDK
jgi:hypothetical protein